MTADIKTDAPLVAKQAGGAAPIGRKPEAEVEEIELVELEEVPEAEEIETEPVFGEEISEELWTGEAIQEKRAEPKNKKGITTETIAELYIKQGYLDKAIDIYQTLYDADPYNDEIKGKLEELKGKLEVSGREPESSGQQSVESEKPETEEGGSVKRLEAWLKSIQSERRKG